MEVGVVFYLEDLTDVSEESGDEIKYVAWAESGEASGLLRVFPSVSPAGKGLLGFSLVFLPLVRVYWGFP